MNTTFDRNLRNDSSHAPSTATVTLELFDLGLAVDIAIPPDNEVIDLSKVAPSIASSAASEFSSALPSSGN
jgi:hypothetical protein